MREFLSYVLESFRDATGWSRDDGYADLNVTANELLHFATPRGLRMTLSSLATPHFATSYTLGSVGVVEGAISYLYSSVPLADVVAQSDRVALPTLLRSYRYRQRPTGRPPVLAAAFATPPRAPLTLDALLPFLPTPNPAAAAAAADAAADATDVAPSPPALAESVLLPVADHVAGLVHEARALVDKPALLYGRLYLPRSMLEAYMVKRLSPSLQLQLRAVSDAQLPNGGTVLGILQLDRGRYGLETLVSSDGGLLGLRGLYNFGSDTPAGSGDAGIGMNSVGSNGSSASSNGSSSSNGSGSCSGSSTSSSAAAAGAGESGGSAAASAGGESRVHGRFSAGGEIYYGTLNKSGGLSFGARFETTVPAAAVTEPLAGTPLTATLTVNPLMGNLSAAYAIKARDNCSLATRFDFNVYSYESAWSVGMELWSTRRLAGLVAAHVVDDDDDDNTHNRSGRTLAGAAAKDAVAVPEPALVAEAQSPPPPPPPPRHRFGLPPRSFQAKLEWRLDDDHDPDYDADHEHVHDMDHDHSHDRDSNLNEHRPEPTAALAPKPTPMSTPTPVSSTKVPNSVANNDSTVGEEGYQGVLKARLDQNLKFGLLWEGRIKSLLFSLGSAVDLHRLDQPFRTLGLEIQFSS